MKQKKFKIASHTLFIYKMNSNMNSLMDTPTTQTIPPTTISISTGILLK
jgi:hypothetical protein